MNELTSATKVALILNPSLSEVELLQSINEEYNIESKTDSKKELLSALNVFLLQQRAQGHTALLIIDECQNLSPAVLEQIRMISNLETVLAPIWVWLVFAERPSDYALLGGALVLGTLVIHTLIDWRQERAVPPAI